ncbi:mediator of RNA polymerase II transcription subunit 15-like [Diachasma alloeum]|uniref:mediator of RNA polymerase II transcription subunit 15-like n=1 Tax=Diachasma alloeum TaxID=454923 RepID=UPI000738263D|nr:mediator of RNA polymerase II transcription subunit 15-like [Diachasma alloeum]
MLVYLMSVGLMCGLASSEAAVNGIKPSNFLGGAEQHASFSFIRPGLTQTSYSFNGPSSHQAFSSSIGNPHLAQKVFPNVAQALAYRNPGLGYFPTSPVSSAYASSPYVPTISQQAPPQFLPYQQSQLDPATLAYYQAQQFSQNSHLQTQSEAYQAQLNQLLAQRQAQLLQLQSQGQATLQNQQIPEQAASQRPQETQNLLGVAYSSAPSVAHVKVTGNGYKFDF